MLKAPTPVVSLLRGFTTLALAVLVLMSVSLGVYVATTGMVIYALIRQGIEWKKMQRERIERQRLGREAPGTPQPAHTPLRSRVSAEGIAGLIVVFLALCVGLAAGFMGIRWGPYAAFAAAGLLVVWTMTIEAAGWRSADRRMNRKRRLHLVGNPKLGPRPEPDLVAMTHRDRVTTRAPDRMTELGDVLLWTFVLVVLLGGATWALMRVAAPS